MSISSMFGFGWKVNAREFVTKRDKFLLVRLRSTTPALAAYATTTIVPTVVGPTE